jgi:predicted ArsR family transcriptional regulator
MDKATQKAKILAYCEEHGSITVRDMSVKLDINSPTKRISELRLSGLYDVQTIEETKEKDNGKTVRYNRYFISARGEC